MINVDVFCVHTYFLSMCPYVYSIYIVNLCKYMYFVPLWVSSFKNHLLKCHEHECDCVCIVYICICLGVNIYTCVYVWVWIYFLNCVNTRVSFRVFAMICDKSGSFLITYTRCTKFSPDYIHSERHKAQNFHDNMVE